jgi:hypothetical protein
MGATTMIHVRLDERVKEEVGLPRLRGRLTGLGGYGITASSWAVFSS